MTETASRAAVPPGGDRRSLPYMPALDGLRAVAVGGVVLFHGGVGWLPGGFLGVDVFFVLSGYLITTLLLRERAVSGSIDLRRFWVRRFRRLLPALLVLVAAVGVAAPFLVDPATRSTLRGDGLAALAYVANWRFVLTDQSYFAGVPSPLRHLWSLAVEEQWYVLFPVVAAFALRDRRGIRWFVVGLAAAAVASAVWMAVVVGDPDPSRAYYGTDTRAHTLLVGALLAAVSAQWPLHRARRLLGAAGVIGAIVVVAAYLFVHEADTWMYRGGFLGLAVATAGVVAAVAVPRGDLPGVGLLAARPLVAVGRVSYGLYLWHWPVDVVLTPDRTGLDGDGWWVDPALLVVRTAVAAALTVLSYRFVEQPIRRDGLAGLRLRFPGPLRSGPATSAVCVALVVWLLVAGTAGVDDEVTPTGVPEVLAGQQVGVPDIEGTVTTVTTVPSADPLPAVPDDRPVRIMITGDSVGASLSAAYDLPPEIAVTSKALIGCGIQPGLPIVAGRPDPISQDCGGWPLHWQQGAAEDQPDVVMLVTGAWEVYDYETPEGERLVNGTEEAAEVMGDALDEGARAVLSVRPDVRFAIVGVPCMDPIDDRLGPDDPTVERTDPERLAWVNEQLEAFADRLGGRAGYFDLGDHMCPDGDILDEVDGVEVRQDGLHYRPETGGVAWGWLVPRILDLARTTVDGADVRGIEDLAAG